MACCTLNCAQITGVVLTILSTILVLIPIGIAGDGAGSEYDIHCYHIETLEIAVATGVLGMIGHIVASVFYLQGSAVSVTTQSPIIVGAVATSSSPATTA